MKFSLHTQYRSLLIATGEDARGLDNLDEAEDASSPDKQPYVAGPPSADLTEAPGPGPDPREEFYDDRRRRRQFGFTDI